MWELHVDEKLTPFRHDFVLLGSFGGADSIQCRFHREFVPLWDLRLAGLIEISTRSLDFSASFLCIQTLPSLPPKRPQPFSDLRPDVRDVRPNECVGRRKAGPVPIAHQLVAGLVMELLTADRSRSFRVTLTDSAHGGQACCVFFTFLV